MSRFLGPPSQPDDAHAPGGRGLKPGVGALTEPVTSTIDRAAALLECQPAELEQAIAAAGLDPWMVHASGAPTYRWPETVEVARTVLGLKVPKTRPTLKTWKARQVERAGRKRRSDARLRAQAKQGSGR